MMVETLHFVTSKLHCATANCIFCIPNFEMCLLVHQIFDFFALFDFIILCEFSQFCIKQREKFPILGVGSCSQNAEKKTLVWSAVVAI